jgi:NADH dehydrogenase
MRAGKIAVDQYLQVEGSDCVWAVGDCASVPNPVTGGYHPPTAQHALRQACVLADNLVSSIHGGRRRPFRFSTLGQLATIGRRTGVANILGINFSGFLAWWLWRTIYLSKLPRLEKKIRVALDWTLDLWFAKDFACVTASQSGYSRSMAASQTAISPAPSANYDAAAL